MHSSILFLLLSFSAIFLQHTSSLPWPPQLPQVPFHRPSQTSDIEEKLYTTTVDWLQADTQAMSCAKCISLMQLGKDLSYMSESFLIATLIRLCGRFQQVHPDVVSDKGVGRGLALYMIA